ncbi:MAG: patatin-like phospholipase family protein [Erysipelotrichia bacterium]|jgi:NTE family protein|nr:patatin-like phospholipase family protein [Erysipelotrichia bacterium]
MINLEIFNKKTGLALSGGGIKSYAQQPVVEFLYSKKIKFNYFAGTSMGSVIATLLALGLDAEELKTTLIRLEKKFEERRIMTPNIPSLATSKNNGLLDGRKLEELLEEEFKLLGCINIEDVKTGLFIISVDILTSKLVIFTSCKSYKSKIANSIVINKGKLSKIIRASCSIPVLFASYDVKGMKLVDGGLLMNLPVTPLLDAGARKIISISMVSEYSKSNCTTILDIGSRSLEMMLDSTVHLERNKATVNINIPLDDVSIIDVGKSKLVFEIASKWIEENREYLSKQLKEKEI